MKKGYLSQYFDGFATKRLSAVEANILASNQHEFNGDESIRAILGEPDGKVKYSGKFIYLTDSEDEPIIEDGVLTWYDARQKARLDRGVMRSEYRLYFPTNLVSQHANEGDLLLIAKRKDGSLLIIVAEKGTTIAQQIQWLFGIENVGHPGFLFRAELEADHDRVEFASRIILENIGVVVEVSEETHLESMLRKFKGKFPTTKEFSAFARSTLKGLRSNDDPDAVLMAWMEREEALFRTLEKHLIVDRLGRGFNNDVDSFINFSLSVHNRRKSRVGLALENHLEQIFSECGVKYSRAVLTERKSKPDFIFPGQAEYRDQDFDALKLTMLGVKSTCKDRWRQVLSEAERIPNKHLLTLEAAISANQTDEMRAQSLQLVLPKRLHQTYSEGQKGWLMDVSDFINLIRLRQI